MLRNSIISEINKFLSINTLRTSCKVTVLYYNCKLNRYHSVSKCVSNHKNPCLSNVNDVNIVNYSQTTPNHVLFDVLKLRDKSTSNSIIDNQVKELCVYYKSLSKKQKQDFLVELATKYSIHNEDVCTLASNFIKENCTECQTIRLQEKLKMALTPKYKWLFIHVGRQENGVKFLVDMRTDILELLQKINRFENNNFAYLQQLSNTLRELFLLWFSVGFLKLERLTWKSSCEMLQRISDYEAVHPVRNWTDLKTRMGPDRRCFVYTHSSMPDEPLVILHTALRKEIVSSTSSIITHTHNSNSTEIQEHIDQFHPDNIEAAIFYSISATQIGLQGIELGNYLIKRVATELAKEFPKLSQFSSLSPIPKFKSWFFDILKRSNNDPTFAKDYFYDEEFEAINKILKSNNVFKELMKQLSSNSWLQIPNLATTLEPIIMRNCVRYLCIEKKRGYALDSVANFHLRNGAEMWRINWMADLSARGLSSSCGIMVNYRYYLDEADSNSKMYIENKNIVISPSVKKLLKINNFC